MEKQRPNDLKKVDKKFDEMRKEKGVLFALGFLSYMTKVDYMHEDERQSLSDELSIVQSHLMPTEIEYILRGMVKNDFVDGFNFAKDYAKQMQFIYSD